MKLLAPAWPFGARLIPGLALCAALFGCGTAAPPPAAAPSAASSSPADQRAALPAALEAERHWLQSWFKGTPVVIAPGSNGSLNVAVPREFSFDPGRSNVKPALGAVLNKVAESLGRLPLARLALVAAPDDGTASTPLAPERAGQVRKYLISRGVPPARIGPPTGAPPGSGSIQLRIDLPPG